MPSRVGSPFGTLSRILTSLFLFATVVLAQQNGGQTGDPDYTCSATRPCALGCCGRDGFCGMGPDYCAPDKCINSCNAKSECDPGGWGPQYAARTNCPLNVCCSAYGFCGTTPEFCGSNQIRNPSCPGGTSANQRTIGYYEGWGIYRNCDAMYPEQIPVAAYSHLNFAFAMIDPVTFSIAPMSQSDVDLYPRITGLKKIYPGLQVWIAIGGWSMNDPDQATAWTFSDLARSTANQQKFFSSLISFMSLYGFDGVDIDWEYPVAEERSGRPEDYANLPVFLRNLRRAFQNAGKSWGVTITLPSSFWYLQHFDIVKIEPHVDWFNMMEYDIHGTWDASSIWAGPYVGSHTNLTEIDLSLKLMWRNNIPPSKVVMGLGFYGRSYRLADPSCTSAGCRFTDGAPGGPCTNSVGTLSYGEIKRLVDSGHRPVLDRPAAVKTLAWNGNWVSYDDAETIKMKVDYANNICLGGTMVWAVSTDDLAGTAARALAQASSSSSSESDNLLMRRFLINAAARPPDNPGMCRWTGCGGSCPAGMSAAVSLLDGCPQGPLGSSTVSTRQFCCPSNDVPQCSAQLDPGGNHCSTGACPAGTQLLTTTQYPFLFPLAVCGSQGRINVCCSRTTAMTQALGQCTWTGCGGSCPSGTTSLTQSLHGDGGDQPCSSGRRSLCCPTGGGSVFLSTTCAWHRNAFHGTCTPGCPQGKVQLAVDTAGANCVKGFGSFCCDPPMNALSPRSDDRLISFEEDVRFMMREWQPDTCSAAGGGLDRRQSRALTKERLRQLALELGVLLWAYNTSPSEEHLIEPYREAWNRQVSAGGNVFPAWEQLSNSIRNTGGSAERDFMQHLEERLCEGVEARENIDSNASAVTELCEEFVVPGGMIIRRRQFEYNNNDTLTQQPTPESGVDDGSIVLVRDDLTAEATYSFELVEEKAEGHREDVNDTGVVVDGLAELAKRVFQNRWTPGRSTATSTNMVDAVQAAISGQLRAEYFRWFPYNGDEIEFEAVFLLGPDPQHIRTNLQGGNANNRYMVVHAHIAPGGTPNNNGIMTISQLNVRHAQTIQNRQYPGQPTRPGSYEVVQVEAGGRNAIYCPRPQRLSYQTGVSPRHLLTSIPNTPINRQARLVLQLIHLMSRWGANGDLFNIANPDPSHLYRIRRGANTGNLQGGGPGYSMFDGTTVRYINTITTPAGRQGLAFDTAGNLYTPPADIVNTPGFYTP